MDVYWLSVAWIAQLKFMTPALDACERALGILRGALNRAITYRIMRSTVLNSLQMGRCS